LPELPDVEGFRRAFAEHATGRTVREVASVDPSMLRDTAPAALAAALRERRFGEPGRVGKLLICGTDGPTLLLHFGMTGSLQWDERPHPHDRLVLRLDQGELHYRNMRKFGGIWLVHDQAELDRIVGRLGPDWLGVSRRRFDDLLDRRRRAIKGMLMDQGIAAGLGQRTCPRCRADSVARRTDGPPGIRRSRRAPPTMRRSRPRSPDACGGARRARPRR
jgi:formamidopyrimidine-DNA glycosylase